ncbi:MAG: response regulator [bacterium]|nr:response regulator [bacterium]
MSKKTIVLADNSYTIRRIVELSFSEEKEIELVSFENSLNLREKLLELRPQIVLADIKLPEFNGYEVCKFVQESESLQHTKVFLLKGGFEPVDEEILKSLRYVDIITKPFDSNALVSNIKKLLEDMPEQEAGAAPVAPAAAAAPATATAAPSPPPAALEEMPSSLPEGLPEINAMPGPEGDISFSDIKEEIDSEGILAGDDFSSSPSPFPDDEVLPSEEITQAQSSQLERDNLVTPSSEDIDNPFKEDAPGEGQGGQSAGSLTEEELNIKRNIAIQEKELEIGSLTLEEINIKKVLDEQKARQAQDPPGMEIESGMPDMGPGIDLGAPPEINLPEPEEPEPDTSELFPSGNLDSVPLETPVAEDFPSDIPEPSEPDPEPSLPFVGEDPKAPVQIGDDLFGSTPDPSQPDPPDMPTVEPVVDPFTAPEQPSFGAVEEQLFSEEPGMPEVDYEPVSESTPPLEAAPPQMAEIPETPEMPEFPAPAAPDTMESFATQKMQVPGMEVETETPPPPALEDLPGVESAAASTSAMDDFQAPKIPEPEPLAFDEPPEPPMAETEPEELVTAVPEVSVATPEPEPLAITEEPVTQEPGGAVSGIQTDEILDKVQDKLTDAIKEVLWEIVPPLAEKIIKEEIETLKAKTEKAFK